MKLTPWRGRALALLTLSALTACDQGSSAPSGPWFVDATEEFGLEFQHVNGASEAKHIVETNGSGAAWLDHDLDGDLDLYLVQGAHVGAPPDPGVTDRLLALEDGRFRDVTEPAGLGSARYGMAAAAPDVDNDGDPDLFVTHFGPNLLYQNQGDATFRDVTETAGLADSAAYHSACAFTDLDRDGDLDLYVVTYVDYDPAEAPRCGRWRELGPDYASYCHPALFDAADDLLYENTGDGTYRDVSATAGLTGSGGKGLGVTVADYDRDGDVDLFVANDSDENLLWRNESLAGSLQLVDDASIAGVDYNGQGDTEACMGCAFADIDGDLDWDLFTVNLSGETNTLWVLEDGTFTDRSYPSGLAGPSTKMVGFGAVIADFDHDTYLDIAIANGHVLDNAPLTDATLTYAQPAHLYAGSDEDHFELLAPVDAGDYFATDFVGRGLAAADVDDDGDLDLVFTNNGGPARLVLNQRGSQRAWIGLELIGTQSARDALDAEITVRCGSRSWLRSVRSAESYLSWHDRRVLVGLGDATSKVDVTIRWPNGHAQEVTGLQPGRYHRIEEDAQ